jgi:hypothetical protein
MEKILIDIKKKTGKIPRSVVLAKKKKYNGFRNLELLKEEMINNNIDINKINQYIEDEFSKIEKEYNDKVNNYIMKYQKGDIEYTPNEKKIMRIQAIEFILKNKDVLEERDAPKDFIDNYVKTEYERINKKFPP